MIDHRMVVVISSRNGKGVRCSWLLSELKEIFMKNKDEFDDK